MLWKEEEEEEVYKAGIQEVYEYAIIQYEYASIQEVYVYTDVQKVY